MRGIVVTAALGLLLTGCGKHYWNKPGAGFAEFSRDHKECVNQSASMKSPDGTQGYVSDDVYRMCLRTRGWVRAQQQEPLPPGWFRGIEDAGVTRLDAAPAQPGQAFEVMAPSAPAPTLTPTMAAATPATALVGTWTGTITSTPRATGDVTSGAVSVTLVEANGTLRWTMRNSAQGRTYSAGGGVEITGDEITLRGEQEFPGIPRPGNSVVTLGGVEQLAVTYTLLQRGARLEGSGLSADNRAHTLTLRRAQ